MGVANWTPQVGTYKDLTGIAEQHFMSFLDEVCPVLGQTTAAVLSKSRRMQLVTIRHLMMCVARYEFDLNTKSVGLLFNRDHSSVIYACKEMENKWFIYGPTFSQMQSLHAAEKIFTQIWGHKFKTVGTWRTRKK